jgi:very-short-patch-repair endonuclease
MFLCDYGCEQEANFFFEESGKRCCSNHWSKCPNSRKRVSRRKLGKKIKPESLEHRKKLSEVKKGIKLPPRTEEYRKKMSEALLKSLSKNEKERERKRQYMLSGGSSHAASFIKNPSKQEVKLRNLVQKFFPTCRDTYQILNYLVDVVIPEKKICIEFDGYYHFHTQEQILYDKKRQKEIEDLGWKFIRYTIFQPFPSDETILKDISLIESDPVETQNKY